MQKYQKWIKKQYKLALKTLQRPRVRIGLIIALVLFITAHFFAIFDPIFKEKIYDIGSSAKLLPESTPSLAERLTYDNSSGQFSFNNNRSLASSENIQQGASLITATAYKDAKKGVSVVDGTNKVTFSLTPKFSLLDGKKLDNKIVYPLANGRGWVIYTMQTTGVKEDIVLTGSSSDTASYEFSLGLGDGLVARQESDGGIGIYGNTLLSSDISAGTEADKQLLVEARKNAEKNTLLFMIPRPVVVEDGTDSDVSARFVLKDNQVTIVTTGLKNASYPLSIDPSIYVASAQQFMYGNNETNINFNVDESLIEKGKTTGARFDVWDTTTSLPAASWGSGNVASGGFLYSIGGTSFSGQLYNTQGTDTYVVPTGVTSITIKMWGGGAGGGGGGNSQVGGAGGGGGFVQSTISVTPGETLTVYVGGGGVGGAFSSAGNDAGGGGGGGGISSLYRSTTPLAIAGGGGGGGGSRQAVSGAAGGAGGGTTGVNGGNVATNNGAGGAGGTQSAGGAGGASVGNDGSAGSSLTGGAGGDGRTSDGADGSGALGGLASGGRGGLANVNTTRAGGGGGGAGYFGGGGGGATSSVTSAAGGGGGGGSSYTAPGSTSVTNSSGTGINPGNSSDPSRAGAGTGGGGGAALNSGSTGSDGLVLVTYGTGSSVNASVNWAKFNTTNGAIDSANPGSGTCAGWCTTAAYNLPSERTNFSLVAYNGFLYAMGGVNSTGTKQSTVFVAKIGANGEPQQWHPTNTDKSTWTYWHQDTGLSSARSNFAAVAYNNRMYVIGGLNASDTPVTTVEYADILPTGQLGSWTSGTALGTSRHSMSAQIYNDRLYILGGSETSISGAPTTNVQYTKINGSGSLNSWTSTTPMLSGRASSGGNFAVIWGGYIYISGGCNTLNASGYCTSVLSDSQVSSINTDGSLDVWNSIGGVSEQRTSAGLIAWRDHIYLIGGCSSQNTSTGDCNSGMLGSIVYGEVNRDGDASTVAQSVASGTAPCSGATPYGCNLPGTTYIGNMLSATIITNGYLYVIGGCTNNGCTLSTGNVAYVAISSTGVMTRPATCPTGAYQGGTWCVDSTNIVTGGIAATSPVVFDGQIYLVGGHDGSGNINAINRSTVNNDGSLSSWTSQSMTGVSATSVSFNYAYARANPSSAGTNPGNLYIFGGCTTTSGAGCTAYTQNVYKCNLQTSGAVASCSTSGQLQIGIIPGDTQTGLGIMSGTVYANYIYLIGGVSPNQVDLKTLRYAKFDNSNNVVAVTGSSWIESSNEMLVGRRRAAAFGYNGYIYVVGGYDATAGVLADIEFIKVNVSDGSLGSASDGFNVSAVTINQRWGLSVSVSNSFAYVVGGCTAGSSPSGCTTRTDVIQTFQVYNNDSGAPAGYSTSANTFSTDPDRIGISSAILNGYIYVAGGCTSTSDCTASTSNVSYAPIDVYGTVGTWSSTTAGLPAARSWGKLEAAGGSLYFIGGESVSSCSATGEALFERYDGLSGTLIGNLYSSGNFPNSPSSTQTISGSNLSGPSGVADNYGGRLSAMLCAPQTGNYRLWIASDDSSELRLSTDSNPANISVVASVVNNWTNVNEWTKFGSQQSATIALTAGNSYYIEGNYKEGTGGDHVEIGWTLPDTTVERPIPNTRYSLPSAGNAGTPQSTVYYATPSSGNITSWGTASNALPNARSQFGSTVWNNRLYVVGGRGTGTGCTGGVCNTVYVSPQLNSGGDITSAWSTSSTSFNVARSGPTAVAYANNLYVLGGNDGTNYLSDTQYSQISSSTGQAGAWTYSTSLPQSLAQADGFAANGYLYILGGRSNATTCDPTTLVAPISANTTISSGNNPTGVGAWFETNQQFSGNRYGATASYLDGKAYIIGGACGGTLTYANPVIQQTTLLSQPQVAKYSIMIDTDSDVFPTSWLLNGVDNSIGAKWQLKYRSMTNTTTSCTSPAMTTWGQETNFGDVTLGLPGTYTPKDGSGTSTDCARFYYFNVTVDSSSAYGYPDDVTRGPTITDLTLQFTADPSKRLMHGRTFTGGLQQPVDTPYYTN